MFSVNRFEVQVKLQGSSRDAFERGPKQSRGPKEAPVRTQADSREVLERLRAVSRGCKEAPGIATRIDRTPCSCRRPGAAVSAPSQALRSAHERSQARVGAAVSAPLWPWPLAWPLVWPLAWLVWPLAWALALDGFGGLGGLDGLDAPRRGRVSWRTQHFLYLLGWRQRIKCEMRGSFPLHRGSCWATSMGLHVHRRKVILHWC